MKKIKFTCSNCQAKLRVPSHLAGVSAPCPKCGHKITAPTDYDSIVEDTPQKQVAAIPLQQNAAESEQKRAVPDPYPVASAAVATSSPPIERPSPVAEKLPERPAPAPVLPAPPAPVAEKPAPEEQDRPSLEEQSPMVSEAEVAGELSPPEPTTIPLPPVGNTPHEESIEGLPDLPESEHTSLPEPAVPKTQPIRVSASSSLLPDVKETSSLDDELPRLDISLGEGASAVESPSLNAGTPTKTKLDLQQPSIDPAPEPQHEFSPDDFIIPEEVFIPPADEIRFDDEEPLGDLENDSPSPEAVVDEFVPSVVPPPIVEAEPEPESAHETDFSAFAEKDDFEPESSFDDSFPEFPADERLPEDLPFLPPLPEVDYSARSETALDEGSFENLFAQQAQSSAEIPALPPEQEMSTPEPVYSQDQAVDVDHPPRDEFLEPVALPEPVQPEKSDSDVLDEMFGSSAPESQGMSKSTVVMLCSLGAVVVISVVLVLFIGLAFGGFSVANPGEESGSDDATSMLMASKEKDAAKEENPEDLKSPLDDVEPATDEAPAVIDPVAIEKADPVSEKPAGNEPPAVGTVTLPGDMGQPVIIADSGGASGEPDEQVVDAARSIAEKLETGNTESASALTFDEQVEKMINGDPSAAVDEVANQVDSLIGNTPEIDLESLGTAEVSAMSSETKSGLEKESESLVNYNPPGAFPAPGEAEGPLERVSDVIDAFLRAPDWETRLKYCYRGDSLRPAIEEYYQKWPDFRFGRYAHQMFQMEMDTSLGGPYWVYLVSESDRNQDQGFPIIIRVEDGNLKVDWEIFAEFNDQHFVKFLKGELPNPGTFRLVMERKSDYYGTDRDDFADLDDYLVYQVSTPYGEIDEFSEYAFVKKDSEMASQLDAAVGLGDEPLAVILTLERTAFDHGRKHYVVKDYVREGWFK